MTPTPGVKVELGDGEHTLRFTNRSLVRLEEQTGQTLSEMAERLQAGSLKTVAALVWAGLLHAEPSVTVNDVVDRLELSRLEDIAEKVGEAMDRALGPERSAEGNGGSAQN